MSSLTRSQWEAKELGWSESDCGVVVRVGGSGSKDGRDGDDDGDDGDGGHPNVAMAAKSSDLKSEASLRRRRGAASPSEKPRGTTSAATFTQPLVLALCPVDAKVRGPPRCGLRGRPRRRRE